MPLFNVSRFNRSLLGIAVLAALAACQPSDSSAPPAAAASAEPATEPAATAAAAAAPAATPDPDAIPVTVENFVRAESDLYFGAITKDYGVGKLGHFRELTPIDKQNVIRMNRDTLYSSGVFDLDAGPVTITVPDTGGRFMSVQVINEDHYTPQVIYTSGPHVLTRESVGTRHLLLAIRTLVDAGNPEDMKQAHALQDAITTEQAGAGSFEPPKWDPVSQKKVRDALLVLASGLPDSRRSFGTAEEVDPVRRLIYAGAAWGGNPDKDAMYLNVTPPKNDGTTVHKLHVGDVPVDGFWSISLYNGDGYFQANPQNAYSVNNITAAKNGDGSVDVQFGGCDGQIPNCLPIMPGWNYLVRLYRPHDEILKGEYTFPSPEPVE